MKTIHFDLETQSHCDLRSCGGYLYSQHPSTRVYLLVCCIDGKYYSWRALSQPRPAWMDELNGAKLVAHNGFHFDHHFLEQLDIKPGALEDSMYSCLTNGLRGGLDSASSTLWGDTGHKDKTGHKVMMSLCKPIRGTLPWPNAMQLGALEKYALRDVELCKRLHEELPYPDEPEVIAADFAVNSYGIRLDTTFAARLLQSEQTDVAVASKQVADNTGGLSARSIKLRDWLADEGCPVGDLRSGTVEKLLSDTDLPDAVRLVLQAKSEASANTASKLTRMLERSDKDNLIKWSLLYYGAHTGRWAGRGIQPHNFPRQKPPKGVSMEQLRAQDTWTSDERKALLRTCLIPREGKQFLILDFASIEARILAWMAGEQSVLDLYAQDEDYYIAMAAKVFGIPEATVDSTQRSIGKVLVLGCGYGLGGARLDDYASAYGLNLAALGLDAYELVEQFRDQRTNVAGRRTGGVYRTPDGKRCGLPRTGGMWKAFDEAMVKTYTHQQGTALAHCQVIPSGANGADIVLPSGRPLSYRRLCDMEDGRRVRLAYSRSTGTLSKLYGGKIVENVDQAIGRDLIAALVVRACDMGYTPPLHVHDEVVLEVPLDATASELQTLTRNLLDAIPDWAAGLPVGIEGFTSPWYTKAEPEKTIKIKEKVLK